MFMAIQAPLYSENLGFLVDGSQDWMDNACGFKDLCFNLPQKQQILQQQQQLHSLQQRGVLLSGNRSYQTMAFSQIIGAVIEKQNLEIDRFISFQNERLRLALQEQRKQQLELILEKCQSKTHFLLNQKDEEIAEAVQRKMELEEFLRKMETENQTWQRVAKENEAMVWSLANAIEELRGNACFTDGVEDAESCCEYQPGEKNWGRENVKENEGQIARKSVCKSCNSCGVCVVFLPCRHLCCCKACEAFLESCPVCGGTKRATIEALI